MKFSSPRCLFAEGRLKKRANYSFKRTAATVFGTIMRYAAAAA
jgi:hypothetical protein